MRLLSACAFAAAIGGTLLASPASAAPDGDQGVALMSATVSIGGLLVAGIGVESAERTGTGRYEVTLVRGLSSNGCTAVASINRLQAPGFVQTVLLATGVSVETRDTSGVLSDRLFSVLAFCSR